MIGIWVTGEFLVRWVHRTNDWFAHHWVRLIVPQTSVETEQAPIVEVVSNAIPAITEVEPTLPLDSLSTLFNTPLMLAATKAPVALLAPSQQRQQKPDSSKRRRQSAPESPPVVAVTKAAPTPTRRSRGHRAHDRRHHVA
jgi:hypothetical protein